MKQKAETTKNITKWNHRLRKYIEWLWDTDLTLVHKLLKLIERWTSNM